MAASGAVAVGVAMRGGRGEGDVAGAFAEALGELEPFGGVPSGKLLLGVDGRQPRIPVIELSDVIATTTARCVR